MNMSDKRRGTHLKYILVGVYIIVYFCLFRLMRKRRRRLVTLSSYFYPSKVQFILSTLKVKTGGIRVIPLLPTLPRPTRQGCR